MADLAARFAVDTFVSSDSPIEEPRLGNATLGLGAVIRAADNSNLVRPDLVARVREIAHDAHVPLQAGVTGGGNDGAAALIIASEQAVKAHGFTPQARILGMAAAGVPPRIMGIGPVPSTRKLMERLNLKIGDFDWIELNEAFAAQALACLRQLGLQDDAAHVNPNGGAIALGHPLGMSGARLALTAAHQMLAAGGKRALATMCVGVGQGVSLAIERV